MQKIIGLLEQWQQFLDEGNEAEYTGFGKWLLSQNEPPKDEAIAGYEFPDQCVTFGRDFGLLTGYAEAWERLAFRDLPIKGFSDFEILNQVQSLEKPTKNSIAQNSTSEPSTVFESMKRLQQKGFLRDQVDENDRRVKRLFLTQEGEQLVARVREIAFKMSRLIVGDLSDEEIKAVSGFMKRLNHFHGNLYHNKSREEVKKIYDL